MASLCIKDAEPNGPADTVARIPGATEIIAVKRALMQPRAAPDTRTTREEMLDACNEHPPAAARGPIPDEAFYDDLLGGV